MERSSRVFKAGTRASRLARVQTRGVLDRLEKLLPGFSFEETQFSSPGDRDRQTDLRESPPDFFTRDLDNAVLAGEIDCAIHSAKDLPDPMPPGLDWRWLPWREDPRDAIVLPKGAGSSGSPPPQPRIGVSSERREAYCRGRFPSGRLLPIRGNIEERLAQLDSGAFDMLVMAGAALTRLGLASRISEWIPLEELPPPEGQGVLALTFREGDPRFLRLCSLFVKAVSFVGAGAGDAGACTVEGRGILGRCEVCLYDSLMDPSLLDALPKQAKRVDVGKRCGKHAMPQAQITALIADFARKGLRVVRLKGGDPGMFGRLAEEIEGLDRLRLPYRVIPGVSSLNAATTGTGMLLTRRGLSRGFCAMTPRREGGGVASVSGAERAKLPVVFFMAAGIVKEVARQLLDDGTPPDCPAAVVFNAGRDDEKIARGTLAGISDALELSSGRRSRGESASDETPGLFIVGEATRFSFSRDLGALQGRRVLLTCSEDLQSKGENIVRDLGGVPIRRPLIRLAPRPEAVERVRGMKDYDWIVLTSPAAARCFVEVMDMAKADLRDVPKLMTCGPGTARAMRKFRLMPDAEPPADFGAKGLLKTAGAIVAPGARILRLRSDKAGNDLAAALREHGAVVDDCVLYSNERLSYDSLPEFDAVFFASGSAVEAFLALWSKDALNGRIILAIGGPTSEILSQHGLAADVVGAEATVEGGLASLAAACVRKALEELK